MLKSDALNRYPTNLYPIFGSVAKNLF